MGFLTRTLISSWSWRVLGLFWDSGEWMVGKDDDNSYLLLPFSDLQNTLTWILTSFRKKYIHNKKRYLGPRPGLEVAHFGSNLYPEFAAQCTFLDAHCQQQWASLGEKFSGEKKDRKWKNHCQQQWASLGVKFWRGRSGGGDNKWKVALSKRSWIC